MQTVVLVSVLIVSVMAEDMQAASFWPEEHLTGTLRTFLSLDLSALVFVLAIKTAFLMGEKMTRNKSLPETGFLCLLFMQRLKGIYIFV